MSEELAGLDPDLVGFDCIYEIDREDWDKPWSCPFKPSCGAKSPSECAAAKQLAKISPAPERMQ